MAADLDSIVSVTITAETLTPDQANFGIPLIAAFFPTTIFAERVRTYTKTSEMVADGFGANDPVVRAAARLIQNPKVKEFKIGRRATNAVQSIRLTPDNTTEGFVVTVSVVTFDGITTVVSRTNGAAETPTTIATALQTLLDAIAGVTAVDNTGSVQVTATTPVQRTDYRALAGLAVLDMTPDPGIVADLTAIRLEDPDFYGVALDSNSKAEVAAAAGWAEAEVLIFIATSADEEVLDDTAGNIAETLEVADYNRTALIWNRAVLSFAGAAWLGKQFPTDPGSSTWKFKALSGISRDTLTATQVSNLQSNDANFYVARAGLNITCDGTMASGRFIDITRLIDAVTDEMQVAIFTLLVNQPKLPYTNASVGLVKAEVRGVLRGFQASDGIDPETDIVVQAPLVQDISAADRGNRLLPDVEFSARIAGAIHSVTIEGVLSI
jgi:hypothetical protein